MTVNVLSRLSVLTKRAFTVLLLVLGMGSTSAQSTSFENLIKYDSLCYLDYYRTRQSLFKQEQNRSHIHFWYKTGKNNSGYISIAKFILVQDSIITYIYRNGYLESFSHLFKQSYKEKIDSIQVYQRYHHLFSLPHLSFGSLYRTYRDSLYRNVLQENDGSSIKFQIKGNFRQRNIDTTFYRSIIISGEIIDSCLTYSGIKVITIKSDSAVTKLYYSGCPQHISENLLDSLSMALSSKYKNYSEIISNTDVDLLNNSPLKYALSDTIIMIDQSVVAIADTSIKLLLFDFWYIGCLPCINSIPFINALNNKFSTRGLKIIAVNNYDESNAIVKEFIKKHDIGYSVALKAENNCFNYFGIKVFPTFLLLDKQGNLLYQHQGYSQSSEDAMERIILKNLKQ